ncbi:glycine radical enzyme activase, YjjW family [Proteiniborus ethanoligenes]|uniref:Glycine radical enzyme activase, YjjW family n=1 Tax=Proteiniborus ethanoligenes TaxID=415015 RepID=A0A1H3NRZ1_9FIRM|nr:YjjW family glycine radical enzyme activase [Proteiniborus ethanoligenes]SDY91696.1 glycine radical enzyme activase, YjjW family [Proteiniborus ethanoligenes]
MVKGLINKIIPFSFVDGPGNRMAIFLQGCNFNCLYCHNPETINPCNNCGLCVNACHYNALSIENGAVVWNKNACQQCDECIKACNRNSSPKVTSMTVEEVVNEIKKVKSFISGITVSGGECTLQSEFLTELFREVKKLGLTTFVDTNGYILLEDKKDFLGVMDKAMVDMKSFDREEHKMLTGKDNETVLKNIRYLASIDKLYEVRTVIVPEVLENYYNVDNISRLIAELNPKIRYKIIKYRPLGVRTNLIQSYTPSDQMMKELYCIAKGNGLEDIVLL